MTRTLRKAFGWGSLSLVVLASGPLSVHRSLEARRQAPTQTLRSRITLVPVDVRVMDRDRRAVTDLTEDDFTILEDGVAQTISLFERPVPQALDANDGRTKQRRVFLVYLYYTWLPRADQFGFTAAVAHFIRERLQPGDLVGITAFGHATDLSADHEAVAQVIERLRAFQESIDRGPDRVKKERALSAIRSRPMPADLQAEFEAVFRVSSASGRNVPTVRSQRVGEVLRQVEDNIAARYWRTTPTGDGITLGSIIGTTTHRLLSLFSAVQYLRYTEGEKHLIHFGGIGVPTVKDDHNIARLASDARVAIHVVDPRSASPRTGVNLEGSMSSRHIADLTGGSTSFAEWPDPALRRIDAMTRAGYLLAYYPVNPTLDGRHRRLTVTVRRPRGATVHYRRSYLAQDDSVPYDHRAIIVQDRIMAAAEYGGQIDDLKVSFTAMAKGSSVAIDARIDAAQISFEEVDGHRVGRLETATFCTSARERLVGELWQTLDLKLSPVGHTQALAQGLRHTAAVPVTARSGFCKVVVYDYPSDRTGSAIVRLR